MFLSVCVIQINCLIKDYIHCISFFEEEDTGFKSLVELVCFHCKSCKSCIKITSINKKNNKNRSVSNPQMKIKTEAFLTHK